MPLAVVLPYFPGIWGSAILMLVFPFFVLSSIKTRVGLAPPPVRLPIFAFALKLNRHLFYFVKGHLKEESSTASHQAPQPMNREDEILQKIKKDIELTESILIKSSHLEEDEKIDNSQEEQSSQKQETNEAREPEKWVLINSSVGH